MKKPVLLLLNDIHAGKDNLSDFRMNWAEALGVCRERGIREIAVGGDMFLSRVSQTLDVLLAVHDALVSADKEGILVTVAEGNHCKVDQEAIRGYNHVFDQHPNVTVVDDFLTLDNPDWDFALHMMSYFPENGSFSDKLNALMQGGMVSGKLNYLYIHQGINGALAQPAADELPAHIFEGFDKVFVGHYHNRTKIKDTEIEYVGSSRQHSFGEDEQKGYTILYSDGSQEFVKNEANVRFLVIDVPVEGVDIHLADRIAELRADGRYRLKVRIHGTEAATANVDRKRLIEAGASKVEIVAEDIEVMDTPETGVLDKFDSRRIRESYEDFCSQKRIDDVALGLSYLSKIESPCGN